MKTLHEVAAEQLDAVAGQYGPQDDRDEAIERWMLHLVGTSQVPDEVLEAMPEVSRHDEPQPSPQEYECGCVAVTRITDRNGCSWLGRLEQPFEMRLALPCDGEHCELPHLRGAK
jgi:hypothetical protein